MMILLDRIDSTNAFLKTHCDEYPDGTMVAAREQTAGRGRQGRIWRQSKDDGIAASVLFRNLETGFHAGVIAGLATLEVVRQCLPEKDFFFKWPNDIYSSDKKIAGILSEGIWRSGKLAAVVCGIGLNVNDGNETLEKIGRPAASLFTLSGKKFEIKKLLFLLEKSIAAHYIRYDFERAQLIGEWKKENRLIGRTVELIQPDGKRFPAEISGIDDDGSLVASRGKETLHFRCGDVRIARQET
ncbi:MAG: biotin--[acetyl-CoA-carboxylase] ligase [Victivallaceae bacterium]|nr:biotin--[acetyl-CoA-carboxylase] ligase [Victivallaceae bacterium]